MSKQTFASNIAQLEAIVNKLENSDIGIEDAVNLFKKGKNLVSDCHKLIANAKNDISIQTEDGIFVPFTDSEAQFSGNDLPF